jgi:hypothetical protein
MKKSLAKQHVTYKTTCYLALILAETPVIVYGILGQLSQY